ncbi:class I SAM-dependent DNA methyltransferase [Undibacter mobilis]|uniref:Class I SAM-dependent methyltransferase n=1 Tax=Undibacter mobilis TaxID=2292256 RepID=A0A371B8F5_9BRAD|nr:class I SAM-dependent methyltransferase [Undibacter mobilis]RDV03875.1 class I SAM-dependent methyltransferase [Undibacter mobilis]
MSDAAHIVDLYERKAHDWAADRRRSGRFFEQSWLDRFLSLAPKDGAILDIGCGFGRPIAAYLIAQGFAVSGIDSSMTMIDLCRRDFPDQDWRVADMRTLDLGRRFAGILAWDSFFHLTYDDQRRMFPLFAAHALPGAPLMFTSGPEHGEAIGNLHGERLYHASLAPDEYRALLAANGFAVIEARMNDPDCGGHSVWLARHTEGR